MFVGINIIKTSLLVSYSVKLNQNDYKYWDGNAVYHYMYSDFLRYENRDTEHLIQCQAIFVCSSPSNGRCHDCKVYQSLFVFTVDVWDPTVLPYFGHIPLQHWSNIGLFSALDFDMLEMDLWPILTTYHTHKSVRFSQVKWRKLQVIPCLSKRSFCLLPIRGCWGKMWTSKGKLLVIQASPRKSSFTQYGMVWYDMVWDGHPSFT